MCKTRSILLTLMTFSLAIGCGTTREAQYDSTPAPAAADDTAGEDVTALITAGDTAWAGRADQKMLESAIDSWSKAAMVAPTAELYIKLSRGHYFLADGFLDIADDAAGRDAHYTEGLAMAEKAIGLAATRYVESVKSGTSHIESVDLIPAEALPAFYWQATNLGKWAASKGFATRLKYKDDVKATMEKIMKETPDYFYSAPSRYFGAFEAVTAGLAGGSLEKSEKYFADTVAKAPAHLGAKVLWAQYYCTKKGDRALYEKLLKEVLAADVNADPEITPENIREQAKATKMLAAIDDEF